MAEDNVTETQKLVGALMKHRNLELDSLIMKQIKQLCKLSNNNVSHAFYHFMMHLKKENSEIRYIALLGMNELFLRSLAFRNLVERNLEEFLELTLETNPDRQLPPPKPIASRLQLKAKLIVADWHTKFGSSCKTLRNAYCYLRSCKKYNFNNSEEASGSSNPLNQHRERLLKEKVDKAQEEMENAVPEILSVVTQIENCFQLLVPLPEDLFGTAIASSSSVMDENILTSDESLRCHGIHDIKSNNHIEVNHSSVVDVQLNKNNQCLISTAEELYKEILNQHLPAVNKWLKIFTKGQASLNATKKAIDLKQSLQASVSKFRELNVTPISSSELGSLADSSDDSDFEEVQEKEGYEMTVLNNDNFEKSVDSGGIRSCNAPLPSGKLCPRQDKVKCPFHGRIIERNQDGSTRDKSQDLTRPSTSREHVPEWQDPGFLADIKAATGVDLTGPKKRKKKNSLTSRPNIKTPHSTPYSRLYKKIFKKTPKQTKKYSK